MVADSGGQLLKGSDVSTDSPRTAERRRSGALARRTLAYPAVCALVLTASACGSSADTGGSATTSSESSSAAPTTRAESSSAGASPSEPMAAAEITIEDFEYRTPVSVRPGATVSVTNMDEAHTVTADDGSSFDGTITAGATVTFTAPTTPGDYAFHCILHAGMNGVLVVE